MSRVTKATKSFAIQKRARRARFIRNMRKSWKSKPQHRCGPGCRWINRREARFLRAMGKDRREP